MKIEDLLKKKFILVLLTVIIVCVSLTWEYFNGGVAKHYLLADDTLPGFSNYLGLISLPILAFITSSMHGVRLENSESTVTRNFVFGLMFGLGVSLLWEFRLESVLSYYILLPVFLSLFFKVHYIESFFGFALGMLYTFGGVLPIIIGLVLVVLSFVVSKITNSIRLRLNRNKIPK